MRRTPDHNTPEPSPVESDGFGDTPTEVEPASSDAHRPTATLDTTLAQAEIGLNAGESIGPYRLLEIVGVGGFGVVWLAEQREPIRRRVALKVIKPGMDSAAVVARFEAERNALSVMDHPNIARVLDGGTTERGLPYFVMEHVPGEPITEYCTRKKLGLNERLEVFGQVCQAVQHAHTKGVIHRDLKPSNILVREVDDGPVVKVIDFGVAKALDQRLSEHTIFTARGHMIGTPEYMAPEQAEGSGRDIDTRADVYSLGVVLYELLTGVRPFDFRDVAYREVSRIIAEVEPPKPSTRVLANRARTTSENDRPRNDSRVIERALRNDLDWVVMKCLAKDRSRRYQAAAALGDDVGRYLLNEPVEAGPPSLRYRAATFARRHRRSLAAASMAVTAFSVALVMSGVALASITTASERWDDATQWENDAASLYRTGYESLLTRPLFVDHRAHCKAVIEAMAPSATPVSAQSLEANAFDKSSRVILERRWDDAKPVAERFVQETEAVLAKLDSNESREALLSFFSRHWLEPKIRPRGAGELASELGFYNRPFESNDHLSAGLHVMVYHGRSGNATSFRDTLRSIRVSAAMQTGPLEVLPRLIGFAVQIKIYKNLDLLLNERSTLDQEVITEIEKFVNDDIVDADLTRLVHLIDGYFRQLVIEAIARRDSQIPLPNTDADDRAELFTGHLDADMANEIFANLDTLHAAMFDYAVTGTSPSRDQVLEAIELLRPSVFSSGIWQLIEQEPLVLDRFLTAKRELEETRDRVIQAIESK